MLLLLFSKWINLILALNYIYCVKWSAVLLLHGTVQHQFTTITKVPHIWYLHDSNCEARSQSNWTKIESQRKLKDANSDKNSIYVYKLQHMKKSTMSSTVCHLQLFVYIHTYIHFHIKRTGTIKLCNVCEWDSFLSLSHHTFKKGEKYTLYRILTCAWHY